MNNHSKRHNIIILLFFLILLTSVILSSSWIHEAQGGIKYVFSSTLCAGVLLITGGFLLFLPGQKQNRLIKESFLYRFMSQREKEGDFFNLLFQGRKRGFGLMWLLVGLLLLFSLYHR